MGWEPVDRPPEWLVEQARDLRSKAGAGELDGPLIGTARVIEGDDYVYKVEFTRKNHGHEREYARQPKHEYFDTDRHSGTCPNCEAYVRRMDGDDYLTCHRCGWQYDPWHERLRNLLPV